MTKSNLTKVTSKKAGTAASKTLTDGRTSKVAKSAAGSALSQRKNPTKTTSGRVATNASKTLQSKSTGGNSKTSAGSALSQKLGKKR